MEREKTFPLAIIGGTGTEHIKLHNARSVAVETLYGPVTVETGTLTPAIDSKPVVFLKRHGAAHAVPPHRINYRANMMALKQLGVRKVAATGAVGSLSAAYPPGKLVLASQFIDFTKTRAGTYYEGEGGVLHADMTEPYCPVFAGEIRRAAARAAVEVLEEGVYVCTEGPRLETPAEIRMFAALGGSLVGMTGVPEVVLARELGLCYAGLCLVTNWAAGLAGHNLTHEEVLTAAAAARPEVERLLAAVLAEAEPEQHCKCPDSGAELGQF